MKGSCVPSIPGCPRTMKVVGKKVSLKWTQPDSDGGAEITGYVVACAATYGTMARRVTVGVTTTVELKLNRGKSYVFAVAAKNAFGVGDFSPFSEEVIIPCSGIFLLHSYIVNIKLDHILYL